MFGQYKRLRNEFTGVWKEFLWRVINRPEATGYGAVYFAQSMLETKEIVLKVKQLSGSGNVAYATEKKTQLGGKVVTMSDSAGYIYDADGIDADKLLL
jgi:glutamate dehydrogenase (NADP+)